MQLDKFEKRQIQRAQLSPVQRGRGEERAPMEGAAAQSQPPRFDNWQQYAGGPIDAQFLASDAATGVATGLSRNQFVAKMTGVVRPKKSTTLPDFKSLWPSSPEAETKPSLLSPDRRFANTGEPPQRKLSKRPGAKLKRRPLSSRRSPVPAFGK